MKSNKNEKEDAVLNPSNHLAAYCAREMMARLEGIEIDPEKTLIYTLNEQIAQEMLAAKYPQTHIESIDVLTQHGTPLSSTFDLMFANLALPWTADYAHWLQWCARQLNPGGLLLFSALGPDTLSCWQSVLAPYLLPNLVDMHIYGDGLLKNGFQDPVLDVDYVTFSYQAAEKMRAELVAAKVVTPDCPAVFAGQKLHTTFELVFGHAFAVGAGANEVAADETGIVKFPLAYLRRKPPNET